MTHHVRGDRLSPGPLHQPPLPAAGLRPPGAGRQLPGLRDAARGACRRSSPALRAGGWLGCNVTIPHKQAVFDLVDAVSEEARLIGAVNTVVCEADGRLSGHNTDAAGFLRALTESAGYDPAGQGAVLLGAGGAALAVAVALPAGGGQPAVDRQPHGAARAEALVGALGRHFSPDRLKAVLLSGDALRGPLGEASLLVNSTSVGMSPRTRPARDAPPGARAGLLGPHLLVYDLVYNPARTPLLRAAEARGGSHPGGAAHADLPGGPGLRALDGSPGADRGDDGARPAGPRRAVVACTVSSTASEYGQHLRSPVPPHHLGRVARRGDRGRRRRLPAPPGAERGGHPARPRPPGPGTERHRHPAQGVGHRAHPRAASSRGRRWAPPSPC